MKRSDIFIRLAPAALAFGLIGCASSGPERSAKAVDTMGDTQEGLTKMRRQVDVTLGSLSTVMSASPEQLRPAFDRYAKDVDNLQSEAQKTRKRFQNMKSKKNDYIASWQKDKGQVRDEELRQIADARNAEMSRSLDKVVESLNEANQVFDPFLSNLNDVRKVLGNDLTPAGQALVANTSVVQNANEKGARVAQSIDAAISEVAVMSSRMSPTGTSKN